MFEEIPLAIGLSSWARAGLSAIVLHLIIALAAISGSHGTALTVRPPIRDTVRIELPRAPASQTVRSRLQRGEFPAVPSAPVVPALRLEAPAASLQLDESKLDQLLTSIRSVTSNGSLSGESSSLDTAAVAASEVDQLPELLGDLKPRYPNELRTAGLSGEALLEYVIDRDGRVVAGSIRIIRSTHPAFARSAIESLVRARFRPARRKRQDIPVSVRQRIRFESRKAF
jgi:TonB family protein